MFIIASHIQVWNEGLYLKNLYEKAKYQVFSASMHKIYTIIIILSFLTNVIYTEAYMDNDVYIFCYIHVLTFITFLSVKYHTITQFSLTPGKSGKNQGHHPSYSAFTQFNWYLPFKEFFFGESNFDDDDSDDDRNACF